MSYTQEELDGLSDEERAALEDDDQEALDASEEDATETQAADGDVETQDTEPVEAETDASDEQELDSTEDQQENAVDPFIPRYEAQPAENFDEQIAQIDKRLEDIDVQVADGDLDPMDASKEARALERQRSEIAMDQRESALRKQLTLENEQQAWAREVKQFTKEHPDVAGDPNSWAFQALDREVIRLRSDQDNQDKPYRWFLEEALRQVEHEAQSFVQGRKPKQPAQSNRPVAQKDRPKTEIPPNLGDMPGAEVPETGDGEFAHLDKLTGTELETALARMSKADQDRYAYS